MSRPVGDQPAARSYYPELDGVRAVAIAMVLLFHMAQTGIPLPGPVILGQTGVDLFFVLSGFLITSILLKSPTGDWREVRTFYIRRVLRIFPLYFAFLAAMAVLRHPVSWSYWCYLQNFSVALHWHWNPDDQIHLWSLAVEEQFYLVWPFLVLFLPRRILLGTLWTIMGVTLLLRIALVRSQVDMFYFTPTRLDGLTAGALLATLQYRGLLSRLRGWVVGAGAISALALLVTEGVGHAPAAPGFQIARYTLTAVTYAGVIGLLLTTAPNAATRWLRARPVRFVGRISYGLYVFHAEVFWLVMTRMGGRPPLVRAIAGLAITFALALLSWYGMERHFLRLKDRVAPERAQFPAGTAVSSL